MISIPLSLFFIIYLILAVMAVVFLTITFHHLVATGTFTLISFIFTFIVFAAVVYIFYGTFIFVSPLDWTADIVLFGSAPSNINSFF